MLRRRIGRYARGLALLLALASQVALPGGVSAAPDVSQTCTAADDLGLATHGACVSTLEAFITNGNAQAVGICKSLGSLGFNNQGECVTTFRRLGF